jgi:hypothetical protein
VTSVDGRFSGRATVIASPIALGALWARERVAELEDRLVADPTQKELIDSEIAELGVRHQIQTRLTRFVAVDEESQVHGEPIKIVQPSERAGDASGVLCQDRFHLEARPFGSPLRSAAPLHQYSPRFTSPVARSTASDLSKATAFAAAEVAKRDPAAPMTERLAFLVLLAALDPANAIPDELTKDALRFVDERSQPTEPARPRHVRGRSLCSATIGQTTIRQTTIRQTTIRQTTIRQTENPRDPRTYGHAPHEPSTDARSLPSMTPSPLRSPAQPAHVPHDPSSVARSLPFTAPSPSTSPVHGASTRITVTDM